MKEKDIKISYDRDSRVLSLKVSKARSVDSDIQGNLVIDYDKKWRIAGINMYKFSFEAFRENVKELKSFARAAAVPLLVR